ncbi:MAG TPA: sensor histidine kinase [Rhizomicrobium sp.]|nr:sensor histidine kinase [Rhizomicrobium sp.]
MQHRSKNLHAKVQALAAGTFRDGSMIDEARRTFVERLSSLARADQWLTAAGTQANLGEAVRTELAPFADQVVCQGCELTLAPQVAQNLAIALHELATNAAKYGAPSCPSAESAGP